MSRTIILISVAGLSLLIIGAERTMGCVLGSTLAILVNGMLAERSAGGAAKRSEEAAAPKDADRDGPDPWKTEFGPATICQPETTI